MDNKETNKVYKKTSHKGRIFLMALAIPALALSGTAVIWPSVRSCSTKKDDPVKPVDPEPETITKVKFLEIYQQYLDNLNSNKKLFTPAHINSVQIGGQERTDIESIINGCFNQNTEDEYRMATIDFTELVEVWFAGQWSVEILEPFLPAETETGVKYESDSANGIITYTQTDEESNKIVNQIKINKFCWMTKFYFDVESDMSWNIDFNSNAEMLSAPVVQLTQSSQQTVLFDENSFNVNSDNKINLSLLIKPKDESKKLGFNNIKLNGTVLTKGQDYDLEINDKMQIKFKNFLSLSSSDTIEVDAFAE